MQASAAVFVLQGFCQNIPPLMAANGRCACLCINQGAVNLLFNRRGSRAGNYFWISNCTDKEKEKHWTGRQPWKGDQNHMFAFLCPTGHQDTLITTLSIQVWLLLDRIYRYLRQCLKLTSRVSFYFSWKKIYINQRVLINPP